MKHSGWPKGTRPFHFCHLDKESAHKQEAMNLSFIVILVAFSWFPQAKVLRGLRLDLNLGFYRLHEKGTKLALPITK